jgi:hypothetical protein
VKFLRHLAAAAAVVGVVVLIGLAWNRLRPSLPGEGPGGRALFVRGQVVKGLPPGRAVPVGVKLPAGAKPVPSLHINDAGGIPGLQLGDLLKAADLVVLRNTALIEVAVIAAVMIVDAGLRKRRRARRVASVALGDAPGRKRGRLGSSSNGVRR